MTRYQKSSDYVVVSQYDKLMELIQLEETFPFESNVFPLSISRCEELLLLMEEIPSLDWGYYVFAAQNDLMSGVSFVWDSRKGETPKTGSSQTVEHTEFKLGELGITKNIVQSHIPKGECVQIQNHWFSGSCCYATIKLIKKYLGSDWNFDVKLVPAVFEWSKTLLELTAVNKIANQHYLVFRVYGQGIARPYNGHDSTWLKNYEPNKLCNVIDLDHNRVRRGQILAGEMFWQY
jgi:hypothetical protein